MMMNRTVLRYSRGGSQGFRGKLPLPLPPVDVCMMSQMTHGQTLVHV